MAYTPVYDSLLKLGSLNLTDAATFGAVWRYAQGKEKKCTASPDKIADRIGVSPNTVRAALKKLCAQGLLKDLTPEANSKAHEYIPTDKALAIIAKEIKEESGGDSRSTPTNLQQDRVPNSGTLKLATSEDGVPEFGRGGYQNLVGGVPEFGTKERINRESTREEEGAPAHEDYLDSVVNGQGKVSEKTDSNPNDQWLEYRDEFLSIHLEMTGRHPDPAEKETIVSLAGELSANPVSWRKSYVETSTNWGGNGRFTLARVVEVYRQGADYEKWRQWKYPAPSNGRDSPPNPPKPQLKIVPVGSDE